MGRVQVDRGWEEEEEEGGEGEGEEEEDREEEGAAEGEEEEGVEVAAVEGGEAEGEGEGEGIEARSGDQSGVLTSSWVSEGCVYSTRSVWHKQVRPEDIGSKVIACQEPISNRRDHAWSLPLASSLLCFPAEQTTSAVMTSLLSLFSIPHCCGYKQTVLPSQLPTSFSPLTSLNLF